MRPALPDLVAGAATAAFGLACVLFVWQPTLASFADDSVSYLVMAQVFSPWQAATPAVAAAFAREAFYPPLYPFLLALAGAAHNVAWAHGLTALLLAAAFPVTYLLGLRWLQSRGAAAAAVVCLALLPAMWINAKGILSEPLFCLLFAATLLALDRGEEARRPWLAGLLLVALSLTRTAALPMVGVLALWLAFRPGPTPVDWRGRLRAAAPALAGFVAYGLWTLVRPSQTENDYSRVLAERGQGFLEGPGGPVAALAASVLRQANALFEGWAGSLMVFWVEGQPLRLALASLVGVLALAGLALRLRRGRPDAWMVAAYLGTLLAWPFYDQMERFLFPVLPVLVLYAFLAAGAAVEALQRPAGLAQALLVALMLALAVPAMAFLRNRSQALGPHAAITDWYRQPDLRRARARAQTHVDLLDDMREIRALTQPADKVMWVAPSYLALLADRQGLAAPDARLAPEAYRAAVKASGADYVFLSRFHPRDTLRDTAWRAGLAALVTDGAAGYRPVHTRSPDGGSEVSSILVKAPR